MIFCFGAMHAIAAKRGDGLRPELLDLLKRSRAEAELETRSSFPLPGYENLGRPLQAGADPARQRKEESSDILP
jgi:hypothetical protein